MTALDTAYQHHSWTGASGAGAVSAALALLLWATAKRTERRNQVRTRPHTA